MAYSVITAEIRRCTGTRRDGARCRAFAVWDHPARRCVEHGGIRTRRGRPTCPCKAYPFVHRPAGGRCRWPLLWQVSSTEVGPWEPVPWVEDEEDPADLKVVSYRYTPLRVRPADGAVYRRAEGLTLIGRKYIDKL